MKGTRLAELPLFGVMAVLITACGGGGGGGDEDTGDSDDGVSTQFEAPTDTETIALESGRNVQAAQDELLVYLDEDVTQSEYEGVIDAIETEGGTVLAFKPELRTIQLRVDASAEEVSMAATIESEPGVSGAWLNEVVEAERTFRAEENLAGYRHAQANQTNESVARPRPLAAHIVTSDVSFTGDYWIDQIGAEVAWDSMDDLGSLSDTTIGIVDTGLPADQGVVSESRIVGRFAQDGDTVDGDDTADDTVHGLHTTAFAAGYKIASGSEVRGVDHHSNVVMVDIKRSFLGWTFFTDVVSGIQTAVDQGADVVNVSIGDGSECTDSAADRRESRQRWRDAHTAAVDHAKRQGSLVVFSAGNNCEKHDDQLLPDSADDRRAAWQSHALIVGASTDDRQDACFSRMGNVVDLMAPGWFVGWGDGDQHSGTSFSAPMVTGAAGLLHGVNGDLQAPEIRAVLLDQADPLISFASASGNHSACASFRDANNLAESDWQGASGPSKLLDLDGAVNTARLTLGVPLTTQDSISLDLGETHDAIVSVTLPSSGVSSMDLLLVIDQSGSYSDDISSLQFQAESILNDLESRVFDVQFGLVGFSDFPRDGYGDGASGDQAFYLHQPITGDLDSVQTAIDGLGVYFGGDVPESQYEAVLQGITGAGRDLNDDGDFADTGEIEPSDMGWRSGSLRVVLLATDASFHDSDSESDYPGAGRTETLAALDDAGAIVYGLGSGGTVSQLDDIATSTGGATFTLSADSAEVAETIASALDDATTELDVTLETIAGANWVTNVTPPVHQDVGRGATVDFTVSLAGQLEGSVCHLRDAVYLWARGDGSSLLGRYKLPIEVPNEGWLCGF
ncbi:S8 family serine peptidase [Ectothiorhodospiraceae bacterium WFHF3C12]|nr:S8 family serine peptidase [Ectothiorhodospiraceae bacterium WFHF3C12]